MRDRIQNEYFVNAGVRATIDRQPFAVASDVLNAPIVEVVKSACPSVRLENVVSAASRSGRLPATTIADYLSLGDNAPQAFLKLPNCGRKTVKELDQIIKSYIAGNAVISMQPLTIKPTLKVVDTETIKQAKSLLHQISLPDELLRTDISVRLRNILKRRDLPVSNLLDYINNRQAIILSLRCRRGAGHKTVKEFEEACDGLVFEQLSIVGIKEAYFDKAIGVICGHQAYHDFNPRTHAPIPTQDQTKHIIHDPLDDLSFEELVDLIIKELDEIPRDVVTRRYGLGRIPETLEAIAGNHGVTRERIRQIQANAVRRMQKVRPGRKLVKALNLDADNIWSLLAGGNAALKKFELSGYLKLAFEIAGETPDSWLERHAVRWRGGWIRGANAPDELEDGLSVLTQALRDRPLPIPLKELDDLNLNGSLDVITTLCDDFRIYCGYLFGGYVGVRAKRTVRLHSLFCQLQKSASLSEITNRYRTKFSDDQCTERDVEIVMSGNPHLFLQIVDDVWVSIGSSSGGEAEKVTDFRPNESGPAPDDEEATSEDFPAVAIRDIIAEVLSEFGPLPFSELHGHVSARLPDDRSENSISPTLISSSRFSRLLPAVYGLPEQVYEHQNSGLDQPRYLLNEKQCRWYVLSRWAGEPRSLYPLWTPLSEYAWCRWAQQHADANLYHSLLAVCSPSNWPTSERETAHWLTVKAKHGLYCLQSDLKYPLKNIAPSPDRVLAATIAALETGYLSWISANQILKRRVDTHVSAGLLAALIAFQVLQSGSHWQLQHKLAGRATSIRQALEMELFKHGSLDLSSAPVAAIIKQGYQDTEKLNLGWVAVEPLKSLLENMAIGIVELDEEAMVEDASHNLDSLLAEKRKEEAQAQHEFLLDSLIRLKA